MKTQIVRLLVSCLLFSVFAACTQDAEISVSIPGLEPGSKLPEAMTPAGGNHSPALQWSGAPAGTRSFVVTVTDPDANNFRHWAIYNIPGYYTGLPADLPGSVDIFDGMVQTRNAAGGTGWFGPSPPVGTDHRYVFTVFAVDTVLDLGETRSNAFTLETALKGHVIAQGSVTYRYSR